MCKCMNYDTKIVIGDERLFRCHKCNDCSREWFDVYQLNHIETVEGNLEENEDWGCY